MFSFSTTFLISSLSLLLASAVCASEPSNESLLGWRHDLELDASRSLQRPEVLRDTPLILTWRSSEGADIRIFVGRTMEVYENRVFWGTPGTSVPPAWKGARQLSYTVLADALRFELDSELPGDAFVEIQHWEELSHPTAPSERLNQSLGDFALSTVPRSQSKVIKAVDLPLRLPIFTFVRGRSGPGVEAKRKYFLRFRIRYNGTYLMDPVSGQTTFELRKSWSDLFPKSVHAFDRRCRDSLRDFLPPFVGN
jgi:hypothetical protein